jgi:NADH dehydrogenase (ubiquinone) 1 beta subcomplex subunit 7
MVATDEEMSAARLDLQWRDYCAHVLIPLNKCRRQNYSLPFKCVDERHAYEKCQWTQFNRRSKEAKEQLRAARREAAEKEEAATVRAAAATAAAAADK